MAGSRLLLQSTWQQRGGTRVLRMASHETPIRVRFCETDMNRHVSQVSYFIYFEEARTRYIETFGISWTEGPFNMVLVRQWADYLKPAHFPDELVVLTDIISVGRSSIRMAHRVVPAGAPPGTDVMCQGESVMVLVTKDQSASVPWPSELRARLAAKADPTLAVPARA